MKTTSFAAVLALFTAVQGVAVNKVRSTVCAGLEPVCGDLDPNDAGAVISISVPDLPTIDFSNLQSVCLAEGLSPFCCSSISGSGVGIDCTEAS